MPNNSGGSSINHSNSYWPAHLPKSILSPRTTVFENLQVAALRYGAAPAIHFLGTAVSYDRLLDEAQRFAGWLLHIGLQKGDRVALYLQNSPQWLVAYYGILRAGGVAVPISPMNRENELRHYLKDSGANVLVVAQDLVDHAQAGARQTEVSVIVTAAYSDYLPSSDRYALPDWIKEPNRKVDGCVAWNDVLNHGSCVEPPQSSIDDLCVLPYTSGSTGIAKGCMLTHRNIQHNAIGLTWWHSLMPGTPCLGVAPFYHVSGLMQCVHAAVSAAACIVVVPRWDRQLATSLMQDYRVAHASIPPTAIIDLLSYPELDRFDLSSIRRFVSGGASMPAEVWDRLWSTLRKPFIEAYGMTEAAATTHVNPFERAKRECLGVPFFDTDSFVIDPASGNRCGIGDPGEIIVRGPQLFRGYWRREDDTRSAHIEIDGKTYYRTGDIGYVDEEGFFFMTDRIKRMINASGLKVWPAEVESILYQHVDVSEVCVVSSPDPYRGETVKAIVVLREGARERTSAELLIGWARERMAAYKYPRVVEFRDSLPKSAAGKILWRDLQDEEGARSLSGGAM